mmetsp:Transcript_13504/g.42522  ORF Transcript_13504/g.42522 Transcript_13504/m.42522 type:complete len:246 (+) Transcript_13504:581-1318(+)
MHVPLVHVRRASHRSPAAQSHPSDPMGHGDNPNCFVTSYSHTGSTPSSTSSSLLAWQTRPGSHTNPVTHAQCNDPVGHDVPFARAAKKPLANTEVGGTQRPSTSSHSRSPLHAPPAVHRHPSAPTRHNADSSQTPLKHLAPLSHMPHLLQRQPGEPATHSRTPQTFPLHTPPTSQRGDSALHVQPSDPDKHVGGRVSNGAGSVEFSGGDVGAAVGCGVGAAVGGAGTRSSMGGNLHPSFTSSCWF